MERPEIILEKIEKLKKELEKSKEYYEYKLVCDSSFTDDMIGLYSMTNGREILSLLNQCHTLQYRHMMYGNVDVHLNQHGRILVSLNNNINEDNILHFIFTCVGEWYLKKS